MAKAFNWTPILVIAGIGFAVWFGSQQGWFSGFKQQVTSTAPAGGDGVNVYGYATNIRVSAKEVNTGLTAGITNGELWSNDGTQIVGETSVAGLTSLTSTGPNNLDGFVMLGNDNYVSGTDRGVDIYYTKFPISFTGKAGDVAYSDISVYNESTPTWTGYDDGTAETTTNITIGAGETISTTELRIQAGADATIGNPQISKPIAICFNATGTGTGSSTGAWDEVRVATAYRSGTVAVPGFLSGYNIIGSTCDVLNTAALSDYGSYRFYIILDPSGTSNPAATASVYAIPIDATYYKNDDIKWTTGFGDDSSIVADADIGMDSGGNAKQVALG